MPCDQAVETGFKVFGMIAFNGESQSLAQQAVAVVETRLHGFSDKSANQPAQAELRLVKTAAVLSYHDALNPMEPLQIA